MNTSRDFLDFLSKTYQMKLRNQKIYQRQQQRTSLENRKQRHQLKKKKDQVSFSEENVKKNTESPGLFRSSLLGLTFFVLD
jgi:hypothetical protein